MSEAPVERCRSCKAEIYWLKTPADKLMPVDKDVSPSGNVRMLPDAKCEIVGKLALDHMTPLERAAAELRMSHFATCKQAQGWRKR